MNLTSPIRLATAVFVAALGVTSVTLAASGSPTSHKSAPPTSCVSSQIKVSTGTTKLQLGPELHRTTTPIIFTNHGVACYIFGTPVLRAVNGPRHVAVANFAKSASMGEMPARHLVATNGTVSTTFTNSLYFSLANCHVVSADGLIVGIPGFVNTTYVPLAMNVCAGMTATSTRLLSPGRAG
jgi:hypothetical protein